MEAFRLPQSPTSRQILHRETQLRALRHTLWIAVVFCQNLDLVGIYNRLTPLLVEIDRQLEEGSDGV